MTTQGVSVLTKTIKRYIHNAQDPGTGRPLRDAMCADMRSMRIPEDTGALRRSLTVPGAPYQTFRAYPVPGGFVCDLGSRLPYARYQLRNITQAPRAVQTLRALSDHLHSGLTAGDRP